MTLSAKELVKRAWDGQHTWSDDYTVEIGKVHADQAYEIVYQPSHEEFGKPYKLSVATLEADGKVRGEWLDHYASLQEALAAVHEMKGDAEAYARNN